MRFFHNLTCLAWTAVIVSGFTPPAVAGAIIDFESSSPGTAAPFPIATGGLTATFSGDGLAVCDISSLGFTLLSGNAAIVGDCVQPTGAGGYIDIGFSQSVYGVSMDFATFPPLEVQLTALRLRQAGAAADSAKGLFSSREGPCQSPSTRSNSARARPYWPLTIWMYRPRRLPFRNRQG